MLGRYLHVRVLRSDEIGNELHELLGVHVRHEAARDDRGRLRRNDGLDPRALIAPRDPVHLESGHHPDALHHFERVLDPELLVEVVPLEARDREAALLEILELLLGRGDDVGVEAGDADLSGLAVHALGDQLTHLGDRIARRSPRRAGVLIRLSRLEVEAQTLEAPEARGLRRTRAGHPDRVGDDDRIRRKLLRPLPNRGLEVRAADLFFELPEEMDVRRHAVVDRVFGAVQRRDRGPLVVGRAAAEIPVALLDEIKRRRIPVRPVCRLHVQVVVDGHGRQRGAAVEAAVHDRVTLRFVQTGLRAHGFEQPYGVVGAAAHLRLSVGLDGDRRNFHELLEIALEPLALSRRIGGEAFLREIFVHGVSLLAQCSARPPILVE